MSSTSSVAQNHPNHSELPAADARTSRRPPLWFRGRILQWAIPFLGIGCSTNAESAADSAASEAASATSGTAIRCDDIGECGSSTEPACQGCAVDTGSCKDAFSTCNQAPDNACLSLNECYVQCPNEDSSCLNDCDARYPGGVELLADVLSCVFCRECPLSCRIDTASCP